MNMKIRKLNNGKFLAVGEEMFNGYDMQPILGIGKSEKEALNDAQELFNNLKTIEPVPYISRPSIKLFKKL